MPGIAFSRQLGPWNAKAFAATTFDRAPHTTRDEYPAHIAFFERYQVLDLRCNSCHP
jgi:hypothetical protein